ncbi:MAG: hypothetical protein H6710_16475 [Myxococcales bacterium]|nr:hypothetical protein [Myxococcales bacterium]
MIRSDGARPLAARARGLAAALVLVACAPSSASTTDDAGESGATTSAETEGEDPTPPPPEAAASCVGAPEVGSGVFGGSLRGVEADPAGVCGVGGPTTYLRVRAARDVDVHVKVNGAGFTPRLEIAPEGCIAGRALVCGEGGEVTLDDVAGGTLLVVAIGAAADEPALAAPPPAAGEPDPLDFTVDVGLQRILGLGEACLPESRGRCPNGAACLAPEGADPDDSSAWVCALLDADTCASAEPWSLEGPAGEIVVDASLPQTDAHVDSCGDPGTRERVLRLALAEDLPETASLLLKASSAAVGLAVRGPGCELDDEIACAPASADGAMVLVDGPLAGAELFLLVELADDASDALVVGWSFVDG